MHEVLPSTALRFLAGAGECGGRPGSLKSLRIYISASSREAELERKHVMPVFILSKLILS